MRLSISFLVLLCIAISTASILPRKDNNNVKVIGGQDAGEFEFPHQVSVRVRTGMGGRTHICGGSIYNETIVITSALCLQRQNIGNILDVLAGNFDIFSYLPGEQEVYVDEVVNHPEFNRTTFDFDVAYLKLRSPLKLNNRTQTIRLANSAPSGNATFIGWGLGDPDWSISDVVTGKLQKITVRVISEKEECSRAMGTTQNITDSMICASQLDTSLCARDAGGPLLCHQGNENVICGISSWGRNPCKESHTTVFTNMNKIKSWLDSQL